MLLYHTLPEERLIACVLHNSSAWRSYCVDDQVIISGGEEEEEEGGRLGENSMAGGPI